MLWETRDKVRVTTIIVFNLRLIAYLKLHIGYFHIIIIILIVKEIIIIKQHLFLNRSNGEIGAFNKILHIASKPVAPFVD
jgi:hypothetical protein